MLVTSAVVVVAVFVTEIVRGHRSGEARLPPAMLFVLRIALGITFAILGVIGSVLPVMQGWLFFLMAALVLFPQSRFAIKALDKVEPKMPRLVSRLRRFGIGCREEDDCADDGDTMRTE